MSSPFGSSADWYNHPTPTNANSNSSRVASQSQPHPIPISHANLDNWSNPSSNQTHQRSSSPFSSSNLVQPSSSASVGTIGGHRANSSGTPSRQGTSSPSPAQNSDKEKEKGLGLKNSNASTESFRQTMAMNAFRNANTSSPLSQSSTNFNPNQKEKDNASVSNGYVTAHSQMGSSSTDAIERTGTSPMPGGFGGIGMGMGIGRGNGNASSFGSPYLDNSSIGNGNGMLSPALSSGFGGGGIGNGTGSVYTTPRLGFEVEPMGSIGNAKDSNKRLSASSFDNNNHGRFGRSFGSNLTGGGGGRDSPSTFEDLSINKPISNHGDSSFSISNSNSTSTAAGGLSGAGLTSSNGTTQSPTSTESYPTSNSGNNIQVGKDSSSTILPRSNSNGSVAYPFPNSQIPQRGNSTPLLNVPSSSSTASHGSLAGGLLSPTAATVGTLSTSNTPLGGGGGGASSPSGLQSPGLGGGSGWQSPSPFSSAAPPAPTGSSNAFDALARSSPLITDVLERLVRLETSVRDVNRQMGGVVRNVSLLIDRTRHLPQQNNLSGNGPPAGMKSPVPGQGSFGQQQQGGMAGGSQRGGPIQQPHLQLQGQQGPPLQPRFSDMSLIQQGVQDVSMGAQSTSDDVRMLSNQLSHLSSSVAQLISGSMDPNQQREALAGLGLGPRGNNPILPPPQQQQQQQQNQQLGTPQMGMGFRDPRERLHSPLIQNNQGGTFGNNQAMGMVSPHLGNSSSFSQGPGSVGGGAGNRMSWGNAGGGMNSPHLDGLPPTSSTRGLPKEMAERRLSSMMPGSGPGPNGGGRSLSGGDGRRDSFGLNNGGLRTPDLDGPNPNRFNEGFQQQGSQINTSTSSALITKWEGLPLHSDLLRSILKYGLGPPNKIQQRALPFLLRGNDIIAQAPPTQERIASYVIPALQLVLSTLREPNAQQFGLGKGPIALIISTTVDQATQAQRMVLGLGASLGIRVHIAAAASIDATQEAINVEQSKPHIIVGTPRKVAELFQHLSQIQGTSNTVLGPNGSEIASSAVEINDVRLVVLDEADQLIARNLSDYVSTLLKLLPLPRSLGKSSLAAAGGSASPMLSPRIPNASTSNGSESSLGNSNNGFNNTMDRQTAIFSNTVPQDVLNFAQSIHLRESVRVLVRREGAGAGGNTGAGSTLSNSNPNSSTGSGGSAPIPIMGTGNNPSNLGGQRELTSSSSSHPSNALGSSPMNSNQNPLQDPILSSLKGMRQYYLYVAVSTPSNGLNSPQIGGGSMMNGSRLNHHETEMKLDVITDLLEDMEFGQLVIYTANANTTELVTYKLASRGIEALALVSFGIILSLIQSSLLF